MSEKITKWLIEHKAARPYPIYSTGGLFPCVDPSNALKFDTRDQASTWAIEHGLGSPWHAVPHEFDIDKVQPPIPAVPDDASYRAYVFGRDDFEVDTSYLYEPDDPPRD